jgi:hypothetical protein
MLWKHIPRGFPHFLGNLFTDGDKVQYFTQIKKKLQVHASVRVKEIGLQKMLKLVSLNLETQADMTPHVQDCCSQNGRRDYSSLNLCLQAQVNQFQHQKIKNKQTPWL